MLYDLYDTVHAILACLYVYWHNHNLAFVLIELEQYNALQISILCDDCERCFPTFA